MATRLAALRIPAAIAATVIVAPVMASTSCLTLNGSVTCFPEKLDLEAGSRQKITPAGPQRLPILNHTDPGQPAFQVHSHQHSDGPIESDGLWGEVGGEEDVAHQRFASARRVHPESAEDGGVSFLGREALRRRHHVPEQLRRNLPTLLAHDVHRPESCPPPH